MGRRGLAGLGQFLNGAAQGYGTVMKFQREDEDERDRKERRDFEKSQRDRTLREQGEADALKDSVKAAAAPVAVQESEEEEVGPTQNGDAPRKVRSYAVGGVKFGTQEGAEQAAGEQNASAAVYDRVGEAYRKAGRLDLYEHHKKLSNQARDEGAIEMVEAIRSSSPSLTDLKKAPNGVQASALPPDVVKNFNGMGKWKLPEDAQVQAFVSKDPSGADVVDHRLVGADGNVLMPSLNDATNFLGLDASQRRAARKDDQRLALDVKRTDASIAHQNGVLDLQRTTAADTRTYHQGMLRVAERNAATTEAYRRDQAEALKTKAAGAGNHPQLTQQDLEKFDDQVLKALGPQYAVKEGTSPEERTQLTNQLNEARAQASGIFRANAVAGNPVPASVVLQARALAQDKSNLRAVADPSNPGQFYPAVVVNGQPVIVGPAQAAKAPPAPAAAAPGARAPAAVAAGGVPLPWQKGMAPAPAQAAPAAAQPSLEQLLAGGSAHNADIVATQAAAAEKLRGLAQSFQVMSSNLRTAMSRGAKAEEISGLAAGVQGARAAIAQAMQGIPPAQQQVIVKSLGIQL